MNWWPLGSIPRSGSPASADLQHLLSPERGNTPGIHPLILETETKMLRGEARAKAADQLKAKGSLPI